MTLIDLLYFALILLIGLATFAVFWLIAGYIIFRTVDSKLRGCPGCKRGATGIIVETETEYLGTHIDRMGRETVRIRTEKVIDHYECNRCGHTWVRSFERKERNPIHIPTKP
jgi:hypothetical protein